MTEPTSPKSITVYQLDAQNCYLFQILANEFWDDPGNYNVPWDARHKAPPSTPAGMVALYVDAADDWEVVEDHRKDRLYYQIAPATSEELAKYAEYQIGIAIALGSEQEAYIYDGLGPVPDWLTAEAPMPASLPT